MLLAVWGAFAEEWEAGEKVSFNGVSKRIKVNDGVSILDIQADVYSAWVRWSERYTNSQYLQAMRFSGLDPIPGGQTGGTFFLTNGWKLEYDANAVAITGVLYSDDYATPYWSVTDSPIYPATVAAVSLSSSGPVTATVDIDAIANAVAAKFAEPSITTAGIASAIGTVDVDAVQIANEVESRFQFNVDGYVLADVAGIDLGNVTFDMDQITRQINRSVQAAIPSPPSASTIWDAAPKWLKKAPAKGKDYSDEIRKISNKLDGLYQSVKEAQQSVVQRPTQAFDDSGLQREIQKIASAIAAIEIPDGQESSRAVEELVQPLKSQLDDVQIAVLGLREDVRELPEVVAEAVPQPDMTSLATKEEVSALKRLVERIENYDDAEAMAALQELAAIANGLVSQAARVDQKVDLVLDNQLQLNI